MRLLGGVPLISHSTRKALRVCGHERVLVITDDDEIAAIAAADGVRVLREARTTGSATLDDVAMTVAHSIVESGAQEDDVFLTIQPTCPFVREERISEAIAKLQNGAGSVLTVSDDRHLTWQLNERGAPVPEYERRLNRQQLPPRYRESGAIIGCRLKDLLAYRTRIMPPTSLIEVDAEEALDIDTFSDWVTAEHIISRRNILLRTIAGPKVGMGHVHRMIAVAQELARHRITISIDPQQALALQFFEGYPFPVVAATDNEFIELAQQQAPDLVILDQLDTQPDFVRALKSAARKVIVFEDLGPGALVADLLISDLYKNLEVPNERQLSGVSNAILAPNFESDLLRAEFRPSVEHILVLFGGTDPSRLTGKALRSLALAEFAGTVSVVIGMGAEPIDSLESYGLKGEILRNVQHMPSVMSRADLALSSGGRTITELISLGVPVLCMCQNEKELTHTHASARFGVVNIGLGTLLDESTVASHIRHMMISPDLRRMLRQRGLYETAGRSNAAILRRTARILGWDGI